MYTIKRLLFLMFFALLLNAKEPLSIPVSPTAQAKRFVSAYLSNKSSTMEKITSKKMINKLRTVDDKVKKYFKTIDSFHEMLYFHDLKAMVIAISQGEEIKFYFSWSGSRWIMDEVL